VESIDIGGGRREKGWIERETKPWLKIWQMGRRASLQVVIRKQKQNSDSEEQAGEGYKSNAGKAVMLGR
jgi:hypothetical protein